MQRLFTFLYKHAEECIIFSLLICLVFSINIEVFRRYVLHQSGAYSEEIARYLMIAIIYLGLPYAMRHRRHIVVDVLPASLPQMVLFIVNMISYALMLVLAWLMVQGTLELVDQQIMLDSRTQAMAAPAWWFSSLIGIGYFLLAIRVVEAIVQDIRQYRKTGRAFNAGPNID